MGPRHATGAPAVAQALRADFDAELARLNNRLADLGATHVICRPTETPAAGGRPSGQGRLTTPNAATAAAICMGPRVFEEQVGETYAESPWASSAADRSLCP